MLCHTGTEGIVLAHRAGGSEKRYHDLETDRLAQYRGVYLPSQSAQQRQQSHSSRQTAQGTWRQMFMLPWQHSRPSLVEKHTCWFAV